MRRIACSELASGIADPANLVGPHEDPEKDGWPVRTRTADLYRFKIAP